MDKKPTKELLKHLVETSTSYKEVSNKLRKANRTGKKPELAKKFINEYGLSTKHFIANPVKYTTEAIRKAASQSNSFADVARMLGCRPHGEMQAHLKRRMQRANIDFSHFKSRAWSKGVVFANRRRSADDILIIYPEGKNPAKTEYLRRSLLEKGHKEICKVCGQDQVWNNKPLRLEIDHINGIRRDCRESNLRFICPHCHSQTDTYKIKNKDHKSDKRADTVLKTDSA